MSLANKSQTRGDARLETTQGLQKDIPPQPKPEAGLMSEAEQGVGDTRVRHSVWEGFPWRVEEHHDGEGILDQENSVYKNVSRCLETANDLLRLEHRLQTRGS